MWNNFDTKNPSIQTQPSIFSKTHLLRSSNDLPSHISRPLAIVSTPWGSSHFLFFIFKSINFYMTESNGLNMLPISSAKLRQSRERLGRLSMRFSIGTICRSILQCSSPTLKKPNKGMLLTASPAAFAVLVVECNCNTVICKRVLIEFEML